MRVLTVHDLTVLHGLLPKIEYNPRWANGTGYFDFAVAVAVDELSASEDDNGRKILFVPCHLEDQKFTVVLFQRSTSDRIVMHAPVGFDNPTIDDREVIDRERTAWEHVGRRNGGVPLTAAGEYYREAFRTMPRMRNMLLSVLSRLPPEETPHVPAVTPDQIMHMSLNRGIIASPVDEVVRDLNYQLGHLSLMRGFFGMLRPVVSVSSAASTTVLQAVVARFEANGWNVSYHEHDPSPLKKESRIVEFVFQLAEKVTTTLPERATEPGA